MKSEKEISEMLFEVKMQLEVAKIHMHEKISDFDRKNEKYYSGELKKFPSKEREGVLITTLNVSLLAMKLETLENILMIENKTEILNYDNTI